MFQLAHPRPPQNQTSEGTSGPEASAPARRSRHVSLSDWLKGTEIHLGNRRQPTVTGA
jgi:hypothetical protein